MGKREKNRKYSPVEGRVSNSPTHIVGLTTTHGRPRWEYSSMRFSASTFCLRCIHPLGSVTKLLSLATPGAWPMVPQTETNTDLRIGDERIKSRWDLSSWISKSLRCPMPRDCFEYGMAA